MEALGVYSESFEPTTSVPAGEYNNTWFDPHIRYWEQLAEWAAEQRKDHGGLRWLEVGCFEGRSAAWLMKNLFAPNDASLTLVDPWGPGPEWQPIYERAINNINIPGLVMPTVMRMSSLSFWEISPSSGLVPDYFDFVYVDGCHKSAFVVEDVRNAWRRLRRGGVILADDFYNPHTPGEERSEVEKGLREVHRTFGWAWPPARWGIDVLYQKVG